jgi:predicted transcriptional regulator of viral defense system
MEFSAYAKLLYLVRKNKIVRSSELDKHQIPRMYLTRLLKRGELIKIERGVYALPDIDIDEDFSLVEVSRKVPKGVICLLSALRFHDLTTQAPFEVWIAIDSKARTPRFEMISIRVFHFSDKYLTEGVETYKIDNTNVNVFSPAKTVADCFKYRNKIGLDVALEALRDVWRKHKATMDELWKYAKICRVANVMRPYLESLT